MKLEGTLALVVGAAIARGLLARHAGQGVRGFERRRRRCGGKRTVGAMRRFAFEGTMPKVGRRTVDDRADPRRLAAASTFTHGNR
jgi:hypothetical protein